MADNISFSGANFATAGMMPNRDEELTAVWGRKMAVNAAAAIGVWGTVVMEQLSLTTQGSVAVDISGLGFNNLPSMSVWAMRGGTRPVLSPMRFINDPPAGGDPIGLLVEIRGGTQLYMHYYADWVAGQQETFSQAEDGTFVYRLTGW